MKTNSTSATTAFSRADFLALLGALGLLGILLVSSAATTRRATEAAGCLRNLGELAKAWQMYADANQGRLVGATSWRPPGSLGMVPDWTGGSWLNLPQPKDPSNWNHAQFTQKSPLWLYVARRETFNCPADPSRALDPNLNRQVRRIRSYSLNCWVGGPGWEPSSPAYRVHVRQDDFRELEPAKALTFLDEREDSINDGRYLVDMNGAEGNPEKHIMGDYPGDLHSRSGQMAFADGHVSTHRWRDSRTLRPHKGLLLALNVPQTNNADIAWLQEHATRRIPQP